MGSSEGTACVQEVRYRTRKPTWDCDGPVQGQLTREGSKAGPCFCSHININSRPQGTALSGPGRAVSAWLLGNAEGLELPI